MVVYVAWYWPLTRLITPVPRGLEPLRNVIVSPTMPDETGEFGVTIAVNVTLWPYTDVVIGLPVLLVIASVVVVVTCACRSGFDAWNTSRF